MDKIVLTYDKKSNIKTLFEGLRSAKDKYESNSKENISNISSPIVPPVTWEKDEISQCMTCKYTLLTREDQVLHYKSDWHRYNTKLKLNGSNSISESNFEDIMEEISSISGSDSDTDETNLPADNDEQMKLDKAIDKIPSQFSNELDEKEYIKSRKPTKMLFQNSDSKFLHVYKCILPYIDEDDTSFSPEEIEASLLKLPKCCVILLSAGHFAAAVFEGNDVKIHKSCHRYIIRAKQGGVQSIKDGKSGSNTAKSAGATLRRHNEAALITEIQTLLNSWKEEFLNSCSHIFLRTPHYHKIIFYNGKAAPFSRKDTRIRGIPFPTRRPTFNEVKRVHQELYSVEVCDEEFLQSFEKSKGKNLDKKATKLLEDEVQFNPQLPPRESVDVNESPKARKRRQKKKRVENDDRNIPIPVSDENFDSELCHAPGFDILDELYTVCKLGDIEGLKAVISSISGVDSLPNDSKSTEGGSAQVIIINQPIDKEGNTLLHVASKAGHQEIVWHLLYLGSDPVIKNKSSIVPYSVGSGKATRNMFRKFMAEFPEKYDYKSALVPSPLTEEMEKEQKRKVTEKKKAQREMKKEKQKEKNAEKVKKEEELEVKERFAALSEREKRAIAAERRFAQQLAERGTSDQMTVKRCWLCGESLLGKIPFEYLEYQFCTVACLKRHKSLRKQNQ